MKVTKDLIKKQVEAVTKMSVHDVLLVPPTAVAFVAVFNEKKGYMDVAVVDYASAVSLESLKPDFLTENTVSDFPTYMTPKFYRRVKGGLPLSYKTRVKRWLAALRTLRSLKRGAVVKTAGVVNYQRLPRRFPIRGGMCGAYTYITVQKVAQWYIYTRYGDMNIRIFLPALYVAGFAVVKDSHARDDDAVPIYHESDKGLPEGLYLALYNGADNPKAFDSMDDFGFNGPVIGPLKYVQTTYGSHIKLTFENVSDAEKYGFDPKTFAEIFVVNWQHLPLALYGGKFYGDWIVYFHSKQ